jgi:carbon-monoxide dehydrogenase medium subunit
MRYEAPDTVKKAAKLLAGEGKNARVLAGGTDLLVQLRGGMVEPNLVVDVKRIDEMTKITKEKSGFRIGAAVSGAALGANKALVKAYPGVVEAARLIGSEQIQGRASLGGNVCNASPAADTTPALIAAGAVARIVGPKATRNVPVEKIATGPGKTSLKVGELIASFFLPKPAPRTGDAYLRFIPRTEMDIAVAGAGVCVTLDAKGVCTAAKVSIGAVAPTALIVAKAAKALIGTKGEDEALDAVAAAASAAANPIDDKRGTVEYRKDVVGVLAKRAAKIAFERAAPGRKK